MRAEVGRLKARGDFGHAGAHATIGEQAPREDPVVARVARAHRGRDVVLSNGDAVGPRGLDDRGPLRVAHVGEYAVEIEYDRLGRENRVERGRQPLEVGRITRQRNAETRLETGTTGKVAHENSSSAESVTDERRPPADVGEYEVCLRRAGVDATRAQEFPKFGSLRADLGHVSAQRGVAASQLSQRERERWPGNGIRPARGAQHGDHIRTPDGVAYSAPC